MLVHGKGDYGGGYIELAQRLQHEGWSCYAPDMQGFGYSPGRRGSIQTFSEYGRDLQQLQHYYQPHFLCGFSSGANWIVEYALDYPDQARSLKGLILISPAFRIDTSFTPLRYRALKVLNRVWPQFAILRRYNPAKNTALSDQQAKMAADPYITGMTRVRFVAELLQSGHRCLALAHQLAIPVLILYTPKDRVVNPQGAVDFYQALQSGPAQATLKSFPNSEHDLRHCIEAESVQETIHHWMVEYSST